VVRGGEVRAHKTVSTLASTLFRNGAIHSQSDQYEWQCHLFLSYLTRVCLH
jgi:hypothetical protein